MNMTGFHTDCRGFSLVEAMVALVLAILISAGVLQVYMASSQKYRTQESTAAMMESGRTAIEMMARSLRAAGYWHCDGWNPEEVTNHLPSNQRGLFGTNGSGSAPDELRTLHALDDTEVAVSADVDLVEVVPGGVGEPDTFVPQPITVSDTSGFSGDEIIVINDCAKADVFQLSGVSSGTLVHNCEFCVESYGAGARLLEVVDTRYYVANNARGQPALFRSVNSGTGEELIEGVEDLQVFFGEDTDGDGIANRYVTADVINAPCALGMSDACWNRVSSVRINVLMRTVEDNVALSPQTYQFNGSSVTATDRRLRRAFTAVVALRNHGI